MDFILYMVYFYYNGTNYSSYNSLPAPELFGRPLHPIEEDNLLCREDM